MTFAWTPEQLAVSSALGAMDTAQKTLEAQIKLCGELSAADAKQSDTNKRYFAEQAEAYKTAVALLPRIREAIANALAAKPQ